MSKFAGVCFCVDLTKDRKEPRLVVENTHTQKTQHTHYKVPTYLGGGGGDGDGGGGLRR